ncbi:MAG: hypothetical protein FJX57_04935 [Alphaproteobacteria bacterium]|nr:hypothetical protein [Alphaproteobacteria bacterium]
MQDRLQTAWRYMNAEVWRPLFDRFAQLYPDLPIEVARAMLERPAGKPIFVPAAVQAVLDALRKHVATVLDQVADARAAIGLIKSAFFLNERAVAAPLADVAVAFKGYDSADLDAAYRDRLARFLKRHALPYRLDAAPLNLTPLLHGEVDALYRSLRSHAAGNDGIGEALAAFEDAWARLATEWSQIAGKEAIRASSLLAENVLVAASAGQDNESTKELNRMRIGNRFPSNDFANIFDRAYTFANTYPNIRHPGNAACRKRDLRREDAVLAALLFVGLSACAHDLCKDEA